MSQFNPIFEMFQFRFIVQVRKFYGSKKINKQLLFYVDMNDKFESGNSRGFSVVNNMYEIRLFACITVPSLF